MSSTAHEDELKHVWVQVFDANNAKIGDAFKINPLPDDISDLRKAVKAEKGNALKDYDADELIVKKLGGLVANAGESIADICSSQYGTKWDNPIHVIAPCKQVEAKKAPGTYFVDVPLGFGCSSFAEEKFHFACVALSECDVHVSFVLLLLLCFLMVA
jgi:hypothetical protein